MSDDYEDDDTEPVDVYRVVLSIVDHDGVGADEIRDLIENANYPNDCIYLRVVELFRRTVPWSDNHPLNKTATHAHAFRALFKEAP